MADPEQLVRCGTKRLELGAAGFAELAKRINCIMVQHLSQLRERLLWRSVGIDDLAPDILRGQDHAPRR